MSIPYTQASMANVRAVDGTYISYPFMSSGDNAKVYNMVCTQLETGYNANQVALDTPMSSAANAGVIELPFDADESAYFVGDTNHTPIGGGMISFNRTFSQIPQSTTLPSGSEYYTFPGIKNGNLAIDSLSMTFGTDGIYITTSGVHGVSVGDTIQVKNVFYYTYNPSTGETSERKYFAYVGNDKDDVDTFEDYEVLEVTSPTTFRIDDDQITWTEQVDLVPESGEVRNPEYFAYDLTGIAVNLGGEGVILTTSEPHTVDVGQKLEINLQFTIGNDPFIYSVNNRFTCLSAPNDTTFIIDIGFNWSSYVQLNIQSGAKIRATGMNRDPFSYNVSTLTRYEYILPGVNSTITDITDIQIPPTFRVVSINNGKTEDKVSDSGFNVLPGPIVQAWFPTQPSAQDYIRMIDSGAHINIESSLTKWAGNILLLKTKYCKAR